jgi:hypothetical protein
MQKSRAAMCRTACKTDLVGGRFGCDPQPCEDHNIVRFIRAVVTRKNGNYSQIWDGEVILLFIRAVVKPAAI